jgi:predicted TIM-barrel fold metal-dependent hydrolase
MLKIDCHFHVNFNNINSGNIIEYLDRQKIEKCWLLTWEEKNPRIPSLYKHLSVDSVLETYQKYPDRIIPFYAPDPYSKDTDKILSEYMKKGIKGCGELKVNYRWDSPEINNYLDKVSELGLPVLFHMERERYHYIRNGTSLKERLIEMFFKTKLINNNVKNFAYERLKYQSSIKNGLIKFPGYLSDILNLEQQLIQHPDIKFIAHGPSFWENIEEVDLFKPMFQSSKLKFPNGRIKKWGIINQLLQKHDNLYCDISGTSGYNAFTRDREKTTEFIDMHHSKIIFGTDNTNYPYYDMLKSFNLSKDKLSNIYFNNANKIIAS